MKRVFFYSIFAVALMSSCAGSNETKENQESADSGLVVEETVVAEEVAPNDVVWVIELTKEAQLDAKDKPIIIDFNAEWCGPCKEFAPHFESVAKKKSGEAMFVSVNVDKWQEVAMNFGAQSIPMVVIVKPNGEKVSQVGYMTEKEFEDFVNKNI